MMDVLLIDASPADDCRTAEAADALALEVEAGGGAVERRRLADLDLRACTGCFGCWVKTPGECVIADDGRALAASVIASDVFALVTPVRFGTYGSLGKSALDRMNPLILPFFKRINGETHHGQRYPRFPRYVVLGTSALADKRALSAETAVFGRLVGRNAINLHCPSYASALVGPSDDPAVIAARMIEAVRCSKEVAA